MEGSNLELLWGEVIAQKLCMGENDNFLSLIPTVQTNLSA